MEIYILPLLRNVAIVDMTKRSDEDLERYFVDLGFRENASVRLMGRKYVALGA